MCVQSIGRRHARTQTCQFLAARLEKFGDTLMTAIENGEAIENRIHVCNQVNAVCRIVMKALRMEARGVDPDSSIAGSAAPRFDAEALIA
jgi:hypothetical protein